MAEKRVLGTAPPRSLYRKIRLVLLEARRRNLSSRGELAQAIGKRGHLDFTYFDPAERDSQVKPSGKAAIGRVIDTCVWLGLIDGDSFGLTALGQRAVVNDEVFVKGIREAASATLKRAGASLTVVEQTIESLLVRHKGAVVPTWQTIYTELGLPAGTCSPDQFKTLLTLLGICGGIRFTRQKLYFPR